MKINKIIAALFIFLLSSSTVFSQKNEISIPDVSVIAGGTITLPVYLDNTEDIIAVQFTLELAEGFFLQTDAATLTERANAHSIVIKETAHNKYMVMVFSATNSPIVGRTGILLHVPLSAQANIKDQTTYPMILSDVVIAGDTGDNLVTNFSVGEITIAASADFEVSNVTTNTDILTPNGKIIVNWQVANVGGQASYAGWKENIYIESTNGHNKYIGTIYHDGILDIKGVVSRSAELIVPTELGAEGDATIRVKLVANSNAGEYPWYTFNNEATSNSTLTIQKVILLQPDTIHLNEKKQQKHRWKLIRSGSTHIPETFTLTATEDARVTLPNTITIPSSQSGAYINLQLTANAMLDSDSVVVLHVQGDNYSATQGYIIIADDTHPTLSVQTTTSTIQEGDELVLLLTVHRASNHDVDIRITSDVTGVFDIPASVVLPAGQTSMEIRIPTIDDDMPNPDRTCTLSLSAAQYESTTIDVQLSDNDIAKLNLTLTPNAISEAAGPLSVAAKITRMDNIDKKLTLRLYDDSEDAIYYGKNEMVMPAGVEEINVNIGPIDNANVDGERTYNITAAIYSKSCSCNATNGESLGIATAPLTIYDNDGATLMGVASASVLQEGGAITITVSHNTPTDHAVTVDISSDHSAELEYPATVVIPAGQSSASFEVKSNGNATTCDDYTAILTLSAEGYAKTNVWFMVSDQTLPDAQIKSIAVSQNEVHPGDTIRLSITLANTGNYALAEATKVTVYLNTQSLASLVLPSALMNGDSIVLHCNAIIPSSVGGFNLYAQVNEDKKVKELNYNNNTSDVLTMAVVSPFNFDITTDKAVYQQGDTVTIYGQLYGNKIAHQAIELYIINNGYRHKMQLTTDDSGAFKTRYTPVMGQMGRFVVGACYPEENLRDELAIFDIYGLKRTNNNYITCDILLNTPYKSFIPIKNVSSIPLTNVKVNVLSQYTDCQITFDSPSTIQANSECNVSFTITGVSISEELKWYPIDVEITADECEPLRVQLYYYVRSHEPHLKANITRIETSLNIKTYKDYHFIITNIGKGETGNVSLSLPSWIKSLTPINLGNINYGDSIEIALRITPTEQMNLNVAKTGGIAINCENGDGLSIPYSILPVSTDKSILRIDVCDEFTYYTDEAPHLANANVVLKRPNSSEIIAQGLTNNDGIFEVELNEGYYTLSVTAEKHDSYRGDILVNAGMDNHQIVNLSYQAITIDWDVVETEVEDSYEIETIVTYETNVPKPVVVIQGPTRINADSLRVGESMLLNFYLVNKGLLTALDVELLLPEPNNVYSMKALSDLQPFDLAPNTSVCVPIMFTRLYETPAQTASHNITHRSKSTQRSSLSTCMAAMAERHQYMCGTDLRDDQNAYAFAFGMCVGSNIMQHVMNTLNSMSGGCSGPSGPSGPSGGGGGSNNSHYSNNDYGPIGSNSTFCDPCHTKFLGQTAKCAVNHVPIIKDVWGIVKWVIDPAGAAKDKAIELCHDIVEELIPVYGWIRKVIGYKEIYEDCIKPFIQPCNPNEQNNIISRRITNQYESDYPSYISEFQENLKILISASDAEIGRVIELFGDEQWLYTDTYELSEFMNVFVAYTENNVSADSLYVVKPSTVSSEMVTLFITRWHNTIDEIESTNTINFDNISEYNATIDRAYTHIAKEGFESFSDYYDYIQDMLNKQLNESSNSVCSTISLKISQQMVMTRQAFRGTLTVFNGSESTAMENVKLALRVTDDLGNVATSHEFQINLEDLQGFDGEKNLEVGWNLDAQQEGIATILFIPTKYAAPMTDKVYSFGGTLSYIDPFTSLEVTRTLHPVTLTVKPSPNLDLTYFMQRDIIGDDPLTEAIEPCEEAEFSLLINNVGYGNANNVRITTNQPKIIDNEKGLLIDFEIMSAQLNGQEEVMALGGSMDTDFGNIPAHSTSYAQWWLRSSLLGHFTDYNVDATHVTSYGNPDLSLLNEVTIHELIRSIDATSDNQPLVGFMTNDIVDAEDIPDMMYLSNGLVEEVEIAQSATITKLSDEAYTLTVTPSQLGWNYGSVSDPTYGLAELKSITRQSDGKYISLRNIWQTDRTLRDGKEPLYENRIHFVDNHATTATENYLLTFEPTPKIFLEISSFEGIPAEGIVLENPLDTLMVTFNKTIDPTTFTAEDLALTVEGKKTDISQAVLTTEDNQTFTIDLSKVVGNVQNGYHVLFIQTNAISDTDGFTGRNGKSTNWLTYNADGITLHTSVYPQHAGTIKCSYLDADNNTVVSNVVDYGTTITLTANPADGYDFVNWTINGEEFSSTSTMEYVVLSDDVQITANFTEKMYHVTVASDILGGAIEGVVSGIYPFGTAFTIQPIPVYGYTFSHWLINDVNVGTKPTIDISVNQPMTISAQFVREIYTQKLVAYPGWNWLSSYLQEPITVEEFAGLSHHIVSQYDEIINDPLLGFIGGISSLEGGKAYKVQSSMAFARVLEGHLYDASSNPITLQTGWNWIGYPYYEEHPLSVIQNPTEGDYITSQEGFAEFADGYWQGSISSFTPGTGYLYKSVDSKPLTFNFASHTAPVCLPKHQINATDKGMEELDIRLYPNTMNITSKLYNGNCEIKDGRYTIYAMCGNELRGIGMSIGDYYYLTIHGEESVDISFVIENQVSGEIFVSNETLEFNSDVVGSRSQPYIIDISTKTPSNLINTDSGLQKLTIYTVLGILLNENASLNDLQKLPQGLYIVSGQKYYVK